MRLKPPAGGRSWALLRPWTPGAAAAIGPAPRLLAVARQAGVRLIEKEERGWQRGSFDARAAMRGKVEAMEASRKLTEPGGLHHESAYCEDDASPSRTTAQHSVGPSQHIAYMTIFPFVCCAEPLQD